MGRRGRGSPRAKREGERGWGGGECQGGEDGVEGREGE